MSLILFHSGDTGNAELRKYVSANVSFDIDQMEPQIALIANKFVRDVLGPATFDALVEAFNAEEEEAGMSEEQLALLPYCQKIIANLACLAHMPIGGVYFSNMGISVPQSTDAAPASQWRIRDIKNSFAFDGFNAIEELLEYLWENGEDFVDWQESEAEARHREFFILTSKEFSKYFWIEESYQLYRMLKPTMRMVERFYVKSVIGKELFDEIKSQILAYDVSEENQYLLDNYIIPAVANLTFTVGAPRLQIDISEFGISQNTIEGSKGESALSKKPAARDLVDQNKELADITGENILGGLAEYLYENAASYPLYQASAQYVEKQEIADRVTNNGDTINDPTNRVHGLL